MKKNSEIFIEDKLLLKEMKREKNSIIGKLHMNCSIEKDIFKNTMVKIWKTTKPFSVLDFGPNTYIFSFRIEEDLQCVMSRKPWLFETSLLYLKLFDGCTPISRMDFSKISF